MILKRVFIIDRIRAVVNSVCTKEQLEVGKKYCRMLIDKWHDDTYSKGSPCMRMKGLYDKKMMSHFLKITIHKAGW